MAQYEVVVRDVTYKGIIVEAESEEEAYEMAQEADGGEFDVCMDGGEWEIISTRKVEEEPAQ